MEQNTGSVHSLQDTAVSAVAAVSKTPFKTAFLLTMGIGLAHVVNFLIGAAGLGLVLTVVSKLLN